MFIVSFLTELLFFSLIVIIAFYLPGKLIAAKLKLTLSSTSQLFFTISLGVILFTFLAYIIAWLKFDVLLLPLILLVDYLAIKGKHWKVKIFDKQHAKPFAFIVVVSILFSLQMVAAGVYGNTIAIRGDDYWHLALINELKVHFPPDNPGFAGVPLKGYHFFFNFLLAELSKTFFISPLTLYFHVVPLFIALLWGFGVYSLIYEWTKDKSASLWAVFFTMFGGSISFILHLQGHTNVSLDDAFGMTQPASSLINPPFSISIVFMITMLYALLLFLRTKKRGWLLPIILIVGLTPMFKVYAGILMMGGLLVISMIELLKKRFDLLVSFFGALVLFFATYWVFVGNAGTLIFAPLWAPHKILLDNMPWYRYDEKQYTYSRLSVIKGLIEIEIYALSVFIVGSLGTRIIGLLLLPVRYGSKLRMPSAFTITLIALTIASLGIPLFFIQSIKVFETTQFTWYFLFFTSLFASLGFASLFNLKYSRVIKIILLVILLVCTLPSAFEKYGGVVRLSRRSLADPYFQAMQYVSDQKNYNATILEFPDWYYNPNKGDMASWFKRSTPAIVAFSNTRSFLNSEYIGFPNLDFAARQKILQNIVLLEKTSPQDSQYIPLKENVQKIFKEYHIQYIYSKFPLTLENKLQAVHPVFIKNDQRIYRVQ